MITMICKIFVVVFVFSLFLLSLKDDEKIEKQKNTTINTKDEKKKIVAYRMPVTTKEFLMDIIEKQFLYFFPEGKILEDVKISKFTGEKLNIDLVLLTTRDVFVVTLFLYKNVKLYVNSDYENWSVRIAKERWIYIPNFHKKGNEKIFELENTLPDPLINFSFKHLFITNTGSEIFSKKEEKEKLDNENTKFIEIQDLREEMKDLKEEKEKYSKEEIDLLYNHLINLS